MIRVVAALVLMASVAAHASVFHRAVRASDGVSLALYRYVGARSTKPAVLLVPGIGMNRHAFDLDGRGLAPFLSAHGRDVFVLEPRGVGASGAHGHWQLTDWVTQDLPAAVSAIERAHPGPLDVVAVGFGGTLVLAATTRELAGKVHRVVALSTPALPEVPNRILATILAHHGPLADLSVEPNGARAFELLYLHHGLFPADSPGGIDAAIFENLGEPASGEWLQWMRSGDLTLPDGTRVSSRLARYALPTLLVLPQADNVAHPEFAAPLRELAVHAPVRDLLLNRLQGAAEDYSHVSMLLGAKAARDVFTPILEFLDAEN